jgi:hypothetical protein
VQWAWRNPTLTNRIPLSTTIQNKISKKSRNWSLNNWYQGVSNCLTGEDDGWTGGAY